MRFPSSFGGALLALLLTAAAAGQSGDPFSQQAVYDLSVSGVALGETGVSIVKGKDGSEARSYVRVAGSFDLSDRLVTAGNGAARSYSLSGTFQGVPISIDITFTATSADFAIDQGGRKQSLGLPVSGDVFVIDNNFIDGFQLLLDEVVTSGAETTFPIIVPQSVALGTLTLSAPREGSVEHAGAQVRALQVDGEMAVGPQTIAITAYLDDGGDILVLTSEPGSARFERRAPAEGGADGPAGAQASPSEAARAELAAVLARQAECLVERDVSVGSAGATLAGKLTLPRSAVEEGGRPAPTLVIVPGSGAVDLDGNSPPLLANGIYRQLAYALACHGYGVLRASKLGIPPSTGDANAVTVDTYAQNLADWLAFLAGQPGVDARRLGVIGHSEGGLVALYAVAEGYASPRAIVLLASPGRHLDVILKEQLLARNAEAGATQAQLDELGRQVDEMLEAVRASTGTALDMTPELQANPVAPLFANAAGLLRSEIALDPAALAGRVQVPVAVLQGEKDIQISVEDGRLLAGSAPRGELFLFPDLTHNLVETSGPALSLPLPGPGAQVSPTVLQVIATYLAGHLSRGD